MKKPDRTTELENNMEYYSFKKSDVWLGGHDYFPTLTPPNTNNFHDMGLSKMRKRTKG